MRTKLQRTAGLTLIELLTAVAIIAVVATIAVPAYQGYQEEAELYVAIQDIRDIEIMVEDFALAERRHPDSLADVGAADMTDPWGQPYEYLNIADGGNKAKGEARKDKFLVPVNSDFDLYSKGKDGESKPPFSAKPSHDDVARANDGGFVGLAKDY